MRANCLDSEYLRRLALPAAVLALAGSLALSGDADVSPPLSPATVLEGSWVGHCLSGTAYDLRDGATADELVGTSPSGVTNTVLEDWANPVYGPSAINDLPLHFNYNGTNPVPVPADAYTESVVAARNC